jgi:hypothetical protein
MSFLLTPVALICPILGGNFLNNSRTESLSPITPAIQEQAICRIHKNAQGVTDLSLGTHSVAIYPIHYVDQHNAHIIFALKLLSQQTPTQMQVWTGNISNQRISSEHKQIHLLDNELQLISLNLNESFDAQQDHLCISFATEGGNFTAAQIQLSIHPAKI